MGLWQSTPAGKASILTRLHEFKCDKSKEQSSHGLDVDLSAARGWIWYRYRPTWIEAKPFSGKPLDLPIHLVLVQNGDEYIALYPVSSHSADCHISASDKWTVEVRRCSAAVGRAAVVECRSSQARDLSNLVREAIMRARAWTGVKSDPIPLTADNPLNRLGFCTWSALGETNHVSRAMFTSLLSELRAAEIPVQAFVIDDGWQDQRHRRLWSFSSNEPFGDLGAAVSLVKETFEAMPGVDKCEVGVWLALNGGYWDGVHPDSPLIEEYACKPFNYTNPYSDGEYWLPTKPEFWKDWFAQLKSQGVSFLKVDNQASLSSLHGLEGAEIASQLYVSMLSAADTIFGPGRVVHSMAHCSTFFNGRFGFNKQAFVWRNSDDFGYIHELRNAHQVFVFSNLSNALVSNHLSTVPDADMFMTAAQYPQTHAVLRAMFPGPVLLSDKPGEHDGKLLGRLIARDEKGEVKVVKCESAAELLPRRLLDTSVLDDEDGTATWAAVKCGNGALLAAFNCRDVGGRVKDKLTRADVEDVMALAGMEGDVVVLRYDLEAGALTAATVVKAANSSGDVAEPAALQDVHLEEMGVVLWRIVPAGKGQSWGLVGQFAGLNCIKDGKYLYAGTVAAQGDEPLPRLDGGESEIGIRTFEVKSGDKA